MYDTNTLSQAIAHQAVASMQATLLPGTFAQLQNANEQLAAAQQQLRQAAEALQAKNAHIEARNAENTALKTRMEKIVERMVEHFGEPAKYVMEKIADEEAAPVESEGGETA